MVLIIILIYKICRYQYIHLFNIFADLRKLLILCSLYLLVILLIIILRNCVNHLNYLGMFPVFLFTLIDVLFIYKFMLKIFDKERSSLIGYPY